MDIPRPERLIRKKKLFRNMLLITSLLGVLFVYVLFTQQDGRVTVDRDDIWFGEVEQGAFVVEVRGSGKLVPSDIWWVSSVCAGRVEKLNYFPGSEVEKDSVIIELSNPEVIQKMNSAELELMSARSALARFELEQRGLLLQRIQVEEGQQVQKGQTLTQVANMSRLRAEIGVSEHKARAMAVGLPVKIDTPYDQIEGVIEKVIPAIMNGLIRLHVRLLGDIPNDLRADMSVDATVVVSCIENTCFVDRPVNASPNHDGYLFVMGENE